MEYLGETPVTKDMNLWWEIVRVLQPHEILEIGLKQGEVFKIHHNSRLSSKRELLNFPTGEIPISKTILYSDGSVFTNSGKISGVEITFEKYDRDTYSVFLVDGPDTP